MIGGIKMGSRYFIEKIKVGVTEGGVACGPVSGDIIVSIKYKKDNEASKWLSNAECMGIPNIFINDYDPFELLMSGDVEDPKWGIGMTNSFEEIDFNDYEDMFEAFLENETNSANQLLRLLIAVTCLSDEEKSALISVTEGKYVDEVDVPISDIEEDYLDCKE